MAYLSQTHLTVNQHEPGGAELQLAVTRVALEVEDLSGLAQTHLQAVDAFGGQIDEMLHRRSSEDTKGLAWIDLLTQPGHTLGPAGPGKQTQLHFRKPYLRVVQRYAVVA